MAHTAQNVDPDEIAKFEQLAARWWDPHSEFKPLHDINPLRLNYINDRVGLKGKTVLELNGVNETVFMQGQPADALFFVLLGCGLDWLFSLWRQYNARLVRGGRQAGGERQRGLHNPVVNLIPYNTVEGLPWKRPSITRQERFADILRDALLNFLPPCGVLSQP